MCNFFRFLEMFIDFFNILYGLLFLCNRKLILYKWKFLVLFDEEEDEEEDEDYDEDDESFELF